MATQQSIMNRAIRMANAAGIDAHMSATIDNDFLGEDFFSTALRKAVSECAAVPAEKNLLKRAYAVTFSSGEAALPATVLQERLDESTLYSATDADLRASYEPNYTAFLKAQFSYRQIGYYTNVGAKILYRGPGQAAGAASGSFTLYALGMPDIPAALTDAIDVSPEVEEKTARYLAEMIRGIKTPNE